MKRPSHIPKEVWEADDNPELTEEDFKRMRPTREMFPGLDFPKPRNGPQRAPAKIVRKSRKKSG
jgi:hypothetical protein